MQVYFLKMKLAEDIGFTVPRSAGGLSTALPLSGNIITDTVKMKVEAPLHDLLYKYQRSLESWILLLCLMLTY